MKRLVVAENVKVSLWGCHRWQGRHNPDGYGRVGSQLAHRRAWEDEVGPIPEGMQIDHLCEWKDCVNVAHLEPVTPRENTLRSRFTVAGINARKTHCIHGHEFTPENTKRTKQGWRVCIPCRRIRRQRPVLSLAA